MGGSLPCVTDIKLRSVLRYCNMDYIVLSTLVGIILLCIIITYDIACQWSKNFKKRMSEFPQHMKISDTTTINTAIPSWHINGHRASCHQNFALGYIKGAGQTYGEEVKISWSHTNPLEPAAHYETLNDHWNGWNFRKIVGFRMLFYLS